MITATMDTKARPCLLSVLALILPWTPLLAVRFLGKSVNWRNQAAITPKTPPRRSIGVMGIFQQLPCVLKRKLLGRVRKIDLTVDSMIFATLAPPIHALVADEWGRDVHIAMLLPMLFRRDNFPELELHQSDAAGLQEEAGPRWSAPCRWRSRSG
jgi:hypothetical protein